MGNSQQEGYAEGVREGAYGLRQAVSASLAGNHYPSIPQEYVEAVLEAIAAVCDGSPSTYIDITAVKTTGMIPVLAKDTGLRLVIHAADLVQITHSWPFCADHDEED
jgi:hypothetical protein